MKSGLRKVGWLFKIYKINIGNWCYFLNNLYRYNNWKMKHTLYTLVLLLMGEEVNFGDCKGEMGLSKPILW